MNKTNLILLSFTFILLLFLTNNKVKAACIDATRKAEVEYNLPKGLLSAVTFAESGRTLKTGERTAWPWTVNLGGKGTFFPDKSSAIKYVENKIDKGRKNIDIGCMQVNLLYHPDAFNNLNEAFDPESNAKWAAKWLKDLQKKHKSWREAVGYYHSSRPKRKKLYSERVFNLWASIKNNKLSIESKSEYVENKAIKDLKEIKKVDVKDLKEIKKIAVIPAIEQKTTKLLNKTNKLEINKKKKIITNPYIIARMEKVKFFRKYFRNN